MAIKKEVKEEEQLRRFDILKRYGIEGCKTGIQKVVMEEDVVDLKEYIMVYRSYLTDLSLDQLTEGLKELFQKSGAESELFARFIRGILLIENSKDRESPRQRIEGVRLLTENPYVDLYKESRPWVKSYVVKELLKDGWIANRELKFYLSIIPNETWESPKAILNFLRVILEYISQNGYPDSYSEIVKPFVKLLATKLDRFLDDVGKFYKETYFGYSLYFLAFFLLPESDMSSRGILDLFEDYENPLKGLEEFQSKIFALFNLIVKKEKESIDPILFTDVGESEISFKEEFKRFKPGMKLDVVSIVNYIEDVYDEIDFWEAIKQEVHSLPMEREKVQAFKRTFLEPLEEISFDRKLISLEQAFDIATKAIDEDWEGQILGFDGRLYKLYF